jgi:diguanylate cyclase (GGDEF)-like protein/PAS domain S-box-containing protein/hemerythrin-like metal-binding protein
MKVDIQTLTLVLGLIFIVQTLVLSVQYRLNRSYDGQLWMALGNGVEALGFLFLGLRSIPALTLFSILGSNACIVLGMMLIFLGILRFLEVRLPLFWMWVLYGLFLLVVLYFSLIQDSTPIRVVNLALVSALINLLTALALFFQRNVHFKTTARILGSIFIAYAFMFLLRIVSALTATAQFSSIFNPSLSQSFFYAGGIVLGNLYTFMFILMINQRLQSEERETQQRFELIFNTTPDAILITKLEDGLITAVNPAFTRITGFLKDEVIKKPILHLGVWSNSEERDRFTRILKETGLCENEEFIFHRKDGTSFTGMVSARTFMMEGQPHIISVVHDITARKQVEEALRESEAKLQDLLQQLEVEKRYAQESAITDGLTLLYNRRHFDATLRSDFYHLKRTEGILSLIMLDVDHFKKYNDTYGHLAGDDCLRKIGGVLKQVVGRTHDTVARYGGEEFAVIMPETDARGALIIANRLRSAVIDLQLPHSTSDVASEVTISVGVVTLRTSDMESPEQVVALTDQALYEAKRGGRNRVVQKDLSNQGNSHQFMQLRWNSNDNSLHPLIDQEHQQLILHSNDLLALLLQGQDKENLIPSLENLLNEVISHFNDEEAILKERSFPQLDEHARLHRDLIDQGRDVLERYKNDTLSQGELINFLIYEVIVHHMLTDDKKFFPYVGPSIPWSMVGRTSNKEIL